MLMMKHEGASSTTAIVKNVSSEDADKRALPRVYIPNYSYTETV